MAGPPSGSTVRFTIADGRVHAGPAAQAVLPAVTAGGRGESSQGGQPAELWLAYWPPGRASAGSTSRIWRCPVRRLEDIYLELTEGVR